MIKVYLYLYIDKLMHFQYIWRYLSVCRCSHCVLLKDMTNILVFISITYMGKIVLFRLNDNNLFYFLDMFIWTIQDLYNRNPSLNHGKKFKHVYILYLALHAILFILFLYNKKITWLISFSVSYNVKMDWFFMSTFFFSFFLLFFFSALKTSKMALFRN